MMPFDTAFIGSEIPQGYQKIRNHKSARNTTKSVAWVWQKLVLGLDKTSLNQLQVEV